MKHIITTGCSFSDPTFVTDNWVNFLEKNYPEHKFYHYGACEMGSDHICKTVLAGVKTLLDDGVSNKDIFVIAAWSGIARREVLLTPHETFRGLEIGSTLSTEDKELAKVPFGQHCIDSFEMILLTQMYLQKYKIDYKFLTYMNIFHKKVWDENGQPEWDMLRDDQVTGKFSEVFLWEEFPNLKYLTELIDWSEDKWWNYKGGGILEWVRDNCKDGFDGPFDSGHPIKSSHKKFAEMVANTWLKNL